MKTIIPEKVYIRDKRSPTPTSELASRVMSSIRYKNTKPEKLLRKALCSLKIGNKVYKLHYKKLPGKPDIVYPNSKLAIFVNGCYWHRCPHCDLPLPKNNTDFWKNKFDKNTARDKKKVHELKKLGWKTMVVWECKVKKNALKYASNIEKKLNL